MPWELLLAVACLSSGLAWASLAARRAGEIRGLALHSLFGGAAAFGFAVIAYDLLDGAGVRLEWERLSHAGLASAAPLAGVIGLVEEGAKLAGLLLVVERGWRTRSVMGAAVGVSAGFAALEALTTLQGWDSPVALARVALGPAAHALLALPLALGVAAFARDARRAWGSLAGGLALSAALHAAGDLSLASDAGKLGYGAALLAAPLWLYLRARLPPRAAQAPVPVAR
ncbi:MULTISPECIES: PrsW family glutamic-type intramembrane protease [unclassified Anaeromyxobacter]|uniref:PrsW family glutamic-type intramembrane protease n=1 Tax=unclassified Anaeromyxobacter TaxID=2620896 RepID=UPI001F596088|nr:MULTISPECIES: PrsW family glutamic-type intramembrane protease [unclassified Anaeromyxobacter]